MTRPPLTSRNRTARDALAAVIIEAFETPESSDRLEDLALVLAGDGVVLSGDRASHLVSLVGLVRAGEGGALLPAPDIEPGLLVERVRSARQALATDHDRGRDLPGALGVAAVLFAAGLFFEVHEVLEREWQAQTGARRRFYQGVIQLAVALHHLAHDNARSAVRLFAAAREKLALCAPSFEGVDVAGLLAESAVWERAAAEGTRWPDALVLPVLRSAT